MLYRVDAAGLFLRLTAAAGTARAAALPLAAAPLGRVNVALGRVYVACALGGDAESLV